MALWPIGSPIGPMTWLYATCAANPGRGLCGDPPTREYCNRFTTEMGDWRGLIHFYYHSPSDTFVMHAVFDYEPWYIGYLVLNPETGQRRYDLEQTLGPLPAVIGGSLWTVLSTKSLEVGTFGKVFCVRSFLFSSSIFEIDVASLEYNGGFAIACSSLPYYPSHWIFDGSDGVIVNLADNYMAVAGINLTQAVAVWKNITGTPQYVGHIPLPFNGIYDVAYEDRDRFWIAAHGGYLVKINYKELRVECFSQLPNVDEEDIRYMIAWDQLRGRLAVFRQKPDDPVTGASRSTLEFYRPVAKAELLTDPVPVNSLRAGKIIPFVYHLIGTTGEPISPYMVTASLDDPKEGALNAKTSRTGVGGMGSVEYKASLVTGEETLRLEANIEDGE